MVDQKVLEEVCDGLQVMMKKYKRNVAPGDLERYEQTKKAHAALRKVILMMTIKGDISDISPIKNGKHVGWTVLDTEMKTKNYV